MARVLIVEDEKTDLLIFLNIVERAGHEVYFASGGEEAIKIPPKRNIDVVVTDLSMPEGHGLELITTLRRLYPEVGIIAVSSTDSDQLAMAKTLGAHAAFIKPVDPHEFLEAIAQAVPETDDPSVRGQGIEDTEMGGTTYRITGATEKDVNEKVRDWKQNMRDMGWDIRWVSEPEKNDDGSWVVEISAHA